MANNTNLVSTDELSHEEWLDYRRKGIGGSDVGCICGLSKYKSPYAVYLAKIDELPKEPQSESAHFGDVFEEIVAREFTKVTGKKVRKQNKMLRSKTHEFMLANLDRVIVGEKAFLECKTTSAYNSQDWDGDKIPETYMLQIQHYMFVTGYEYCYIACLIGGQKFVWKRIERDNELIDAMIEIEKNFWYNHVMAKVPPMLNGGEADGKILSKLYPEGKENTEIPLGAEALNIIDKLNVLKEQKEKLDTEITNCENLLKNMLGENEKGTIQNMVVTWKTVKNHRVDSKRLSELYPDAYVECLHESSYRKFSIKMLKK